MDSNKIAQIADVMEDRGLTRVRVEEPDGSAFELERGVAQAPAPVVVAPQVVAAEAPLAPVAAAAPSVPAAPAPGADPFVRVGSKVKKGETLCIIEAMKVMNEVAAESDGEVLSINAKDGELVEYGSCLMTIG